MTSAEGGGGGGHMNLTPLWLPLVVETRGINKQLEQVAATSGTKFTGAFSRATGRGMSQGIEQASRQVGASMNAMAGHVKVYEAAQRKAADATGKLRVAQTALTAVQNNAKATATQLATAEERAAKAKRDATAATSGLKNAERSLQEQHRALGQTTTQNTGLFRTMFNGLRDGHRQAMGDIDGMGRGMQGMSIKGVAAGGAVGLAIAGGLRMASAGFTGMIHLAETAFQKTYQLGEQWDAISDQIKIFTTTTGTGFEALNRSAQRVAASIPGSLDGLGQNIGIIHSRLGLTGKSLEDFARQGMEAGRMLGETLNMRKLTGAMVAFGVPAEQTTQTLNDLFNIARSTGVPINDLIASTQKGAVFLKRYGLSFSQSASLLSQFDMAGVDTARLVKSLGKGMEEFAKQGKSPAEGLKDTLSAVQELMAAGKNDQAVAGLQKLFGAGAGTQIFSLIETGALSLDSLQAGFQRTGESIDGMVAKTDDVPEKIGRMVNRAKVAARPLAEGLFGAMGPGLDKGLDWISNNQDKLVQGFVTAGQYALGFGKTMGQLGVGVLRVWSLMARGGSLTVGSMIKAVSSLAGYVGGFLDTIGMDTIGQGLKDLSAAGSDAMNAFDKLPDVMNDMADGLQHGFIDKVPAWQEGLQNFGDDVIEDAKLTKALGENIISGIPDTKDIHIEGNAQEVKDQFHALGIEIETTPDGKIVKVTAPTQEAADRLHAFIKKETGQDINVDVVPVDPKTGKSPRTLKEMMPWFYDPPPINVPVSPFAIPGQSNVRPGPGGAPPPGFPAPARPGGGGGGAPSAGRSPLGDLGITPQGGRGGPGRGATFASAPTSFSGSVEQWRPYVQQAVATYLPQGGNAAAWEQALLQQIDTESGGNPTSVNPNDSNGRGGTQRVAGLLNFLDTTYAGANVTGLPYMDPYGQIAAAIALTLRHGMNADGSPKVIGQGHGFYQTGGEIGRERHRHGQRALSGADFATTQNGIILAALAKSGVPEHDWPRWLSGMKVLTSRESGNNILGSWDTGAVNDYDVNARAGNASVGVAQVTPGTASMFGITGDLTDPATNLLASIAWIRHKYGDISNVQQANPSLPPKGYRTGGSISLGNVTPPPFDSRNYGPAGGGPRRNLWWGGEDGLPPIAGPNDRPNVPWLVPPNRNGTPPSNTYFPKPGEPGYIWGKNRRDVQMFDQGGQVLDERGRPFTPQRDSYGNIVYDKYGRPMPQISSGNDGSYSSPITGPFNMIKDAAKWIGKQFRFDQGGQVGRDGHAGSGGQLQDEQGRWYTPKRDAYGQIVFDKYGRPIPETTSGNDGSYGSGVTGPINMISDAAKWVGGQFGKWPLLFPKHETGGTIGGVDLGRDSVHIMAQPGEFMVRQKQAKKWGPLLHALNQGHGVFGMAGGGVVPEIEAVAKIAEGMGLRVGSELRDEPGSYHNSGEAVDIGAPGQEAAMNQFAAYMYQNYGSQLAELIHDSPEWSHNIKDGADVGAFGNVYTMAQAGEHKSHVHIAIKGGSIQSLAMGNQQFPGGATGAVGGPGGSMQAGFGNSAMSAETTEAVAQEQAQRAEAVTSAERANRGAQEALSDAIYARDQALAALEEAKKGGTDEFGNPTAADPKAVADAQRGVDMANRQVRDSTEGMTDSEKALTEARTDALKPSEVQAKEAKGSGAVDSNAQTLGGGLVKGLLEGIGLDGSVFGDPTEWGIFKLAVGGLNWGAKLMQNMGKNPDGTPKNGGGGGTGFTGFTGGGGGGGLLDGLFSGLGVTGMQQNAPAPGPGLNVSNAVSNTAAPGSAVAAATNVPGGPGYTGPLGAPPGPVSTDQSVNFYGPVNNAPPAVVGGINHMHRQPDVGFPSGVPHP